MKFLFVSCVALLFALVSCDHHEDHHDEHHDDHHDDHHDAPREKSECEVWRERAQARPIVGGITPECEENGHFKHFQCHPESHFCQCWTDDGRPITQPSTKITQCDCIIAQHDAKAPDAFHPECNENGSFKHRQCHENPHECWCVDDHGHKVSEPSADTENVHC